MKVLLTGATGYIGSVVAEKLKKAGHEVLALARSDEAEKRVANLGYAPVRGDVTDAERVSALARGADAVIHAANTNDARNAQADPTMTAAVLRALEGTGKAFVYTSGVWSLGDTGVHTADESWPATPLALVAWRGPVEEQVLAAAARGVRGVVMRPAIVYGRAGGIPAMLVDEARKRGAVRIVGDGQQEWPAIHVEDLADLYVRALDATPGSLVHGVTGTSYRVSDIATAASIAGGAAGKTERWPLEDARRELGGFADALALHQRISAARTRWAFGWTPKGPSLIEDLLVGSYAKRD